MNVRIVPSVNTPASTVMGHSPVNVELTTKRHKIKEAVLVKPSLAMVMQLARPLFPFQHSE